MQPDDGSNDAARITEITGITAMDAESFTERCLTHDKPRPPRAWPETQAEVRARKSRTDTRDLPR